MTTLNSANSDNNHTFQGSGITELDLSNTKITSIANSTFSGAASLATVKLPAAVTSIGNQAFQGSGISTINLEATQVTTIGQGAFANTTNLATLKCQAHWQLWIVQILTLLIQVASLPLSKAQGSLN